MNNGATMLPEALSRDLKRFIGKRIANHQDAEDIQQEVYCRIFRNLNTLNDTDKVHAWVFRIAHNAISDYYRTRRITQPLDVLPEQRVIFPEENVNKKIAGCLPAMVGHLPAKDREALVLTEYKGLTQKEMAEKLGLSLSGAKSRVQRAKWKLRKILCGCCKLELDRHGNIIEYKLKAKTNPFCNLGKH